jgi:hypothetical protein
MARPKKTTIPSPGHNSGGAVDKDRMRDIVSRIENVEEQRAEFASEVTDSLGRGEKLWPRSESDPDSSQAAPPGRLRARRQAGARRRVPHGARGLREHAARGRRDRARRSHTAGLKGEIDR